MKRSEDLQDYLKIYKNGLVDDTLPFWINNCIDQKYGGFTFCLGRDGTVIDSDIFSSGIISERRWRRSICQKKVTSRNPPRIF